MYKEFKTQFSWMKWFRNVEKENSDYFKQHKNFTLKLIRSFRAPWFLLVDAHESNELPNNVNATYWRIVQIYTLLVYTR